MSALSKRKNDGKDAIDCASSSESDDSDIDPSLPGPSKRGLKRKQGCKILQSKRLRLENASANIVPVKVLGAKKTSKAAESGVNSVKQGAVTNIKNVIVTVDGQRDIKSQSSKTYNEGETRDEKTSALNEEAQTSSSDALGFPEINLDEFQDTHSLQKLGLDHLKAALEGRQQ